LVRIIEKTLFGLLLRKENGMTSLLSRTDADRIGRNNFIKSAVTFDVGKDRLLNYDLTQNNNDSYTLGNGPGFSTNDASVSTGLRQTVVTYQKSLIIHLKN
jgi:hypothetical protein